MTTTIVGFGDGAAPAAGAAKPTARQGDESGAPEAAEREGAHV